MKKQVHLRMVWCDLARTIAIISVVACHCIESIYPMVNAEEFMTLSKQAQLFCLSGFTFGRLGVPIFLMLSGYLNLSTKDFSQEDKVRLFYKDKVLPLLICIEIWTVLFEIFNSFFWDTNIVWKDLLQRLLFLKPISMMHTWYLPIILGLYLVYPLVGVCIKGMRDIYFLLPLLLTFIACYLLPLVNTFAGWGGLLIDISFSGMTYGLYILVGFFILHKRYLCQFSGSIIACLAIGMFCVTVAIQAAIVPMGVPYAVWYNSPTLLLCAVALLELIRRMSRIPPIVEKVCCSVSRHSFGIYLVHAPVLMILQRDALFSNMKRLKAFFVLFVITFLASYGAVGILRKNRVLRQYLFLK